MQAYALRPIEDASVWTGASLGGETRVHFELSRDQIHDLTNALARIRGQDLALPAIHRESFALKRCDTLLDGLRHELVSGRGFALLHGFPVEDLPLDDLERLYWGFCAHLGTGLTQNSDATLIHYVTEGRLRPNQGTRGVGNPGPVSLHVDLADIVTLLCVKQAPDSPPSRLASSGAIHNALLESDPEGLARLYEGFVWDRQNEHEAGESPTTDYRVPMFSAAQGQVSCRYNRNWITKALERYEQSFSDAERALLDRVDALAAENCLEFDFEPGDVQFANNYTVLHGRAPHQPARNESELRVLMRIWFNLGGIRHFADDAVVRHGIVRHGRLGWTAADVAAGLEGKVHARRDDGAPRAA